MLAKAESGAVRRLREATAQHGVKASEYLVALQYINTLKEFAQGLKTKAVLIPANSLNTIGSIMQYSRPTIPGQR